MATTYKGTNRTLADNPVASNIMAPGLQAGNVRVLHDTYEADAILSGSIIEIGEYLPRGAHVIEVILQCDALGSSVTLTVGDYEDADRYIAVSSTWNTANQVQRTNAIGGKSYKVDEEDANGVSIAGATTTDRQIIITTGGATASGTIKLVVLYSYE